MKYNVICRKVELSDSRKEKLLSKVSKLDKFFDAEIECKILITEQKGEISMEVTFVNKGFVFRAEARNKDLLIAADGCLSKLDRQIRKNKTKLAKHLRQPGIENYDSVVEDFIRVYNILKSSKSARLRLENPPKYKPKKQKKKKSMMSALAGQ